MAFITSYNCIFTVYFLLIDHKLHESRKLSVVFTNIYSVLAKSLAHGGCSNLLNEEWKLYSYFTELLVAYSNLNLG